MAGAEGDKARGEGKGEAREEACKSSSPRARAVRVSFLETGPGVGETAWPEEEVSGHGASRKSGRCRAQVCMLGG